MARSQQQQQQQEQQSLLSLDKDAEDVVDKNDLNTQKGSTSIDIEFAQEQHQSA
ncbi:hypothetical protein DPMN_006094 [Dreissena polymorpha]|uniref:Uncharacterized protein n=1 Tax=Dreissena polymorpha TaxID=45954 RepID=A0A9D4RX64_DREPO|nr:hypothetical protein DPMN_006094 [Dreissena polymorpha]